MSRAIFSRHIASGCCAWALLLFASSVRAQTPEEPEPTPQEQADALFESNFEINHEKPESKIPTEEQRNAAPAEFGNWLMAMTELAERASQEGDHNESIKYFRALALAVPDSPAAFRRLCDAHDALNQRERAEQYCGAALNREGVRVSDYVHYVNLVLKQPGPLSAAKTENLNDTLSHLRGQRADPKIVTELECLYALKLQDEARLQACTQTLRQQQPNGHMTIAYEWRLAVLRLDRTAAEAAVVRAKQHGVPAATVKTMEEANRHLMHPVEKLLRRHGRSLIFAAIALLAAVGGGLYMWRRRASRATAIRLQDSNATIR